MLNFHTSTNESCEYISPYPKAYIRKHNIYFTKKKTYYTDKHIAVGNNLMPILTQVINDFKNVNRN